jgi:predicted hydrocarbon binding protein
MAEQIHESLGGIVCIKALITGMEDALGEKATAVALTTSGKTRGKKLALELNLTEDKGNLDAVAKKLNKALGVEGTRLLILEKIVQEGDVIKVYNKETICSAGELKDSPRKCTFTLGAIWGALEEVTGKKLVGKHTESILRGSDYDVFEFTVL